jgi:TRAP-type uncharacterized transport system substrate-binding protein
MRFSLTRLCCLGAALLALPCNAAEAQTDASAKAPSATAAQRSSARTLAAKEAAKPVNEKPVSAQEQPRAARHNSTVVGLAAGRPEDSFSGYAADLATVLDDGEHLRVLPMASYGAAGNIADLLYLNNVDVAITYADVLDHFKATEKVPNIEQRLQYIIPMFQGEVHLLVRPEIKTIQDLVGKKVGLDTHGSGANHTGAIVFERLGVQVEKVALSNAWALEAMRANELAGIVHLASKPNELFAKIDPALGFHFLGIEYSDKFRDYYVPAEISNADYPNLVKPGSTVRTISVQALLAVFNWPSDSERYRRSARFVEALFNGFERLRSPPFQRGWREMNLAATIPGWTRFAPAQQILNTAGATSWVEPDLASESGWGAPLVSPAEQQRSPQKSSPSSKQQKRQQQ